MGVGLYAGHATQPYINSQSARHGPLVGHEAVVQAWERARQAVDHTQTAATVTVQSLF